MEYEVGTLLEKEGGITYVEDVRVAAICEDPIQREAFRRNIRDELRMSGCMQSVIAEDEMLELVKLTTELEEWTVVVFVSLRRYVRDAASFWPTLAVASSSWFAYRLPKIQDVRCLQYRITRTSVSMHLEARPQNVVAREEQQRDE